MRPVIGISMNHGPLDRHPLHYDLSSLYPAAIEKAGGLPLLLPHTHDPALRTEMLAQLHGLLIPGGDDIDPALFGQPAHHSTIKMDAARQAFDLAMLSLAEQRGMPVLGICLGCQLMNVQRGGTLHQSIADLGRHGNVSHKPNADGSEGNDAHHPVKIAGGSGLAKIFRTNELNVNSRHRQAIDRVGYGLLASAVSPDDLIEALEDITLDFWIGVQWHAEGLTDDTNSKLFAAFIAASAEFSRNAGIGTDSSL